LKPNVIRWRKAIMLSIFLHAFLWTAGSYLSFHLHASPPVKEAVVEIDVTSAASSDQLEVPQSSPPQPETHLPEQASETDDLFPPDAIRDELADTIPVPVPLLKTDQGATVGTPVVMRSGGKHSGMGTPPVVLSRVDPVYPSGLPQPGVKVTVVLRMQILENGLPGNVVVAVSGPKSLNDAAIAAVKKWRFQPAKDHEGNPMICSTILAIPFEVK
jgi:protein TonB